MKKESKKVGKCIKAVKRTVLGIGPLVPGQIPLEQDVKMLGTLEKFNRHRLAHVQDKVKQVKDQVNESMLGFTKIEHYPEGHFFRTTPSICGTNRNNNTAALKQTVWPEMKVLCQSLIDMPAGQMKAAYKLSSVQY